MTKAGEDTSLSAKDVARELGTDARTFRKFMRDTHEKSDLPGQGNRYAIEADELDDIKAAFAKWNNKAKTTEAVSTKKTKRKAKEEVIEVDEEDIPDEDDFDIVDLDDLDDPSEEDLEDIEDFEEL